VAYLNAAGTDGAASPQVLQKGQTPSNKEYIIASNNLCGTAGANCGYSRPGAVAYGKPFFPHSMNSIF